MQVVILCGGQGTRIRDVADDVPKPMIPIGGRPILWHIMKGYAEHGFSDFVLCLGYKSWVIKRYFLDYHLASADFRVDLARNIPSGTTIYDVLALDEADDDRSIEIEDLVPKAKRIGALTTESEFIASAYGDYRLFFKHSGVYLRP